MKNEPSRERAIWIKFKGGKHYESYELAEIFSYFGNVEVTKDSKDSAFIEFNNFTNNIQLEAPKLMDREAILELLNSKYDELLQIESVKAEESDQFHFNILM